MCDPVTMTAVTTMASTAYSVVTQQRQGRFQEKTADYNARVAQNEAVKTREKGVEEENIQRRKTAELLSKQKAQLGAAGVELGSGSALQLQEQTETLGEVDALRIRSNFEDRALSLETGAELTEQQGEFAKTAAQTKSFGTLLSGTAATLDTGIADKWFTPSSSANQLTATI